MGSPSIGMPFSSNWGNASSSPNNGSSPSSLSGKVTSVANFSTGRLATAMRINAAHACAGARPPSSPPIARASSRPIQTPVVRPLEKPRNQPSLLLEVVPVLPATGRPILAARPVPVATAVCIKSVIAPATQSSTSCTELEGLAAYRSSPSIVVTLEMP